MEALAALLTSLDLSRIYASAKAMADAVALYLSPSLLIIAIYIRLMETQVDALTGGGKYGAALKDMLIWGTVLGCYYGAGSLIFAFANQIYAWIDASASLQPITKMFQTMLAKNLAETDSTDVISTLLWNTGGGLYTAVATLLYFTTLLIFAFLAAFLKLAIAFVFGVAFIWGLVAIPISISTSLRILRGWAQLCAFSLVWPLIVGLLTGMVSSIFLTGAEGVMLAPDENPIVRQGNVMMLFSMMHLLLCAVLMAAPFLAMSLVTNAPGAAGIVMPFIAAAGAAGAAGYKALRAGGRAGLTGGAGAARSASGSIAGAAIPVARAAMQIGQSASSDSVPAAMPPEGPAPAMKKKQDPSQRRRGVLITQQQRAAMAEKPK